MLKSLLATTLLVATVGVAQAAPAPHPAPNAIERQVAGMSLDETRAAIAKMDADSRARAQAPVVDDPYGFQAKQTDLRQGMIDDLAAHLKAHLDAMRLMGRAYQCKVIDGDRPGLGGPDYFGSYSIALQNTLFSSHISGVFTAAGIGSNYERGKSDMAAWHEGQQAGRATGGCDDFLRDRDWAFKLHTLAANNQWLPY